MERNRSAHDTKEMDLPENKIICGDCFEVMKDWPDNCVDLVLTDPPYGIDYQSAWRTDRALWKPKIANDKLPYTDWIKEAYRLNNISGRCVTFCRWDVEDEFRYALVASGYQIKSEIVWDKLIHGMGDLNGEFAPQHENLLYATKGRYKFTGKRPTTIIREQRVMPEKLKHPNEKPLGIGIKIIRALTNSEDIVFDCMCGVGTFCVAAKMLGRRYIGIDISEKYCEIARQRLKAVDTGVSDKEQRKGQQALFPIK